MREIRDFWEKIHIICCIIKTGFFRGWHMAICPLVAIYPIHWLTYPKAVH